MLVDLIGTRPLDTDVTMASTPGLENGKRQWWRREHKARDQGQDHKKSEAKDCPFEDRPSRGQEQECSRPRTKDTGASVPKKKIFKNFFLAISNKKKDLRTIFSGDFQKRKTKKVFANFLRGFWRFPTNFKDSKYSAILEPRTGQFSRT